MKPWRYPPRRKYQARDPVVTSQMMAAVKSKGSKAERLLRRELWGRGYRYRLHHRSLVGRPDLVFTRHRVAVFVDSDFWHARTLVAEGENALRATIRGARQDWWIKKLTRNATRDVEVTKSLTVEGWTVIRVWESEVLANPGKTADLVERILRRAAVHMRRKSSGSPKRRGPR